jgi:hypothetical protein
MFIDPEVIEWIENFDPLHDLLDRTWPFTKTKKAVEGVFSGMENDRSSIRTKWRCSTMMVKTGENIIPT